MSTAPKQTTILKYPSGRIGVCINYVSAAKYSYFYTDTTPSILIASFDPLGVGFVNHNNPNKAYPPWFTCSKKGGIMSEVNGDVKERFDWAPKRPSVKFGISKPTLLRISPSLQFMVTAKYDLKMTFRGSDGFHEFECGAPNTIVTGTYLDKITHRSLTNHITISLSNYTTLRDQQTMLAQNPAAANMKMAQEYGWTLPRASASAAELIPITDGDLREDITGQNDRIKLLNDFRTSVGRNVVTLKTTLRETAKDPTASINLGVTLTDRPLSVASATYTRAVPPPPLPEVISNRNLMKCMASAKSDQLQVVCCSDRGAGECRTTEKAFARLHRATNATIKKIGVSPDQHTSKLILADCSRQPDCLAKRFSFNVYPMYIYFYGGKLVAISNRFCGNSSEIEDLPQEIERCLGRAKKNLFLPEGFKFLEPMSKDNGYKDV